MPGFDLAQLKLAVPNGKLKRCFSFNAWLRSGTVEIGCEFWGWTMAGMFQCLVPLWRS